MANDRRATFSWGSPLAMCGASISVSPFPASDHHRATQTGRTKTRHAESVRIFSLIPARNGQWPDRVPRTRVHAAIHIRIYLRSFTPLSLICDRLAPSTPFGGLRSESTCLGPCMSDSSGSTIFSGGAGGGVERLLRRTLFFLLRFASNDGSHLRATRLMPLTSRGLIAMHPSCRKFPARMCMTL